MTPTPVDGHILGRSRVESGEGGRQHGQHAGDVKDRGCHSCSVSVLYTAEGTFSWEGRKLTRLENYRWTPGSGNKGKDTRIDLLGCSWRTIEESRRATRLYISSQLDMKSIVTDALTEIGGIFQPRRSPLTRFTTYLTWYSYVTLDRTLGMPIRLHCRVTFTCDVNRWFISTNVTICPLTKLVVYPDGLGGFTVVN
jgi:hypothetical protein